MQKGITLNELVEFLQSVDKEFPIPVSEKVEISKYAEKIFNNGVIKYIRHENGISGIVAGYINDSKDNLAYISIVVIKEQYRGLGLASKLICEFIECCELRGKKAVHVYTHKSNNNAIKMYKKLEFKKYRLLDEPRKDDIHYIYNILQ